MLFELALPCWLMLGNCPPLWDLKVQEKKLWKGISNFFTLAAVSLPQLIYICKFLSLGKIIGVAVSTLQSWQLGFNKCGLFSTQTQPGLWNLSRLAQPALNNFKNPVDNWWKKSYQLFCLWAIILSSNKCDACRTVWVSIPEAALLLYTGPACTVVCCTSAKYKLMSSCSIAYLKQKEFYFHSASSGAKQQECVSNRLSGLILWFLFAELTKTATWKIITTKTKPIEAPNKQTPPTNQPTTTNPCLSTKLPKTSNHRNVSERFNLGSHQHQKLGCSICIKLVSR